MQPSGRGTGNSRNGTSAKTILTEEGEIAIEVPRDRAGSFEPQLIAKVQTRFDGFKDKIISLYARGMTVREIQGHLAELYGVAVSPDLISRVTDAVLDEVKEWQNRPLDPVYPVVFFDALRVKIRDEGCTGLLLPVERKSVEPMATVTAPDRTAAQHQSLLHFVGEGRWLDEAVLAKVQEMVLPKIENHGPIEAWIIDDTGFPKKGRHSVGVARQYCGQLGKQDNCQIAVSLSLANHDASLPVAWRLYLPEEWAGDAARRRKTHVPKEIGFKTKPEIAFEQIRAACEAGLPRGVVLMDAGYGANTELRRSITALDLTYVAGILPNTTVWPPGMMPARPKTWSGRGHPS